MKTRSNKVTADRDFCILYNADLDRCRGLRKVICKTEKCPFFKNIFDYEIDSNGYIKKKESK